MLALSGCDEKRTLQPPVIYFGQHECDVCRMIISDERYAAGMIIEDEGGRFQSRVFDDIGCLLQQEQDDADLKIAARYVRDAQTSQWLDVAQATYLHSETLKTPMAFHTAACASPDQAKTMQQDHPGDVLSLNEVRERFRAGTLREF